MSSEMRDMLIEVLDAIDHPDHGDGISRATYEKARTLLARTEAGADGDGFLGFVHECVWEDGTSRTIYEKQPSLLRERPGLTSQRIVRAYTRPQDASGDAREAQRYRWLRDEASRAQLEMFADRRGTRLAADRVCDAGIDIAMQAKEAK